MDIDLFKVSFEVSIDAYSRLDFPVSLPFRPMVGDKVPYRHQNYTSKLPVLVISSVSYETGEWGQFERFVCILWFDKNTDTGLVHDVLNHKYGG